MQRRKDYDHSRLLQKQYNRAAKTAKIAELTISQDMPAPPEFSHAQRNRFKNNVLTVLVLKTGLLGLQQPGIYKRALLFFQIKYSAEKHDTSRF